ncbi:MAG: surface anchored protein [Corynebacterium sp.]|uniref:SpaA isopeptide-forming pilin-related protein n=1 Tax=Corynebacterium sp. TaxID=1720 RepID=UPI0026DC7784|nr:SpaA isopeptide-forming pilin-related protein [Corynebacterium sp.]MDO5030782.1 surface anchored protein [Corynebacterium sp.]
MIKHCNSQILGKSLASGLIAACAFTGIGLGTAQAARIVGDADSVAAGQTAGTDSLSITLSQGNPDDEHSGVTGSISGVTIHLNRLSGIDPRVPADKARVEKASIAEIQDWSKNLHYSAVTDDNGTVRFSNLEPGVYLVSSTAPDGNYREINSFLVAVPFYTVTNNPNPVEGVVVAKSHKPGTPPPTTPDVPPTTPGVPPTTPGVPPTVPGVPPVTTTPGKPPTPGIPGIPGTPGTPTTPTQPGTPGTSGQSGVPGTSGSSESKGPLAITGVQALGLAGIAAMLIGGGVAIIVTAQRKNRKG